MIASPRALKVLSRVLDQPYVDLQGALTGLDRSLPETDSATRLSRLFPPLVIYAFFRSHAMPDAEAYELALWIAQMGVLGVESRCMLELVNGRRAVVNACTGTIWTRAALDMDTLKEVDVDSLPTDPPIWSLAVNLSALVAQKRATLGRFCALEEVDLPELSALLAGCARTA